MKNTYKNEDIIAYLSTHSFRDASEHFNISRGTLFALSVKYKDLYRNSRHAHLVTNKHDHLTNEKAIMKYLETHSFKNTAKAFKTTQAYIHKLKLKRINQVETFSKSKKARRDIYQAKNEAKVLRNKEILNYLASHSFRETALHFNVSRGLICEIKDANRDFYQTALFNNIKHNKCEPTTVYLETLTQYEHATDQEQEILEFLVSNNRKEAMQYFNVSLHTICMLVKKYRLYYDLGNYLSIVQHDEYLASKCAALSDSNKTTSNSFNAWKYEYDLLHFLFDHGFEQTTKQYDTSIDNICSIIKKHVVPSPKIKRRPKTKKENLLIMMNHTEKCFKENERIYKMRQAGNIQA